MTTWNHRLLPYPLLAPWTDDYDGVEFGLDVPEAALNNGQHIRIRLAFRLTSKAVQDLLSDERARYAVEVSCPRTFTRTTHVTLSEDELLLNADDYVEEVLVTPYVISTDSLGGFSSPEHSAEWSTHKPEGFSIPAAGIIAVGNTTRVTLEDVSVNSVIDLITNPNVPDGTFDVQLDDERIKIHVPVTEKQRIEAVRKRRGSGVGFAALFPALYLHAVTEALRNLSDYEHTRWAFTVINALDRQGHTDVDRELLRIDALRYAQELMDQPVGTFLTAALRSDDEE